MNIPKWLLLFAGVLFAACSSDSSSSAVEEEMASEGSSDAASSSSVSYGIVPIDTTSPTLTGIDDMISITSASKTIYNFTTEKTTLYDTLGIYVNAYYAEKGLQGNDNRTECLTNFTYRLLNSPVDTARTFVGWLVNGMYWSDDDCPKDSAYFTTRCNELVGELVDYKDGNGCSEKRLQMSCVYPYAYTDSVAALNTIAAEFLDFALENWVRVSVWEEDSLANSESDSTDFAYSTSAMISASSESP